MPGWTLRTENGDTGPLTIYQLQQRLHAGQVRADDFVRLDDGDYRRVADVPALAKLLKTGDPATSASSDVVVVNGVSLRKGPDGKPLPPTPAELARLLRAAEPQVDVRGMRRGVLLFAVFFAIASGIFAAVIVKLLTASTGTSAIP